MVPIEVVIVLLWLICGFVGVVRRFPVELGATILFVGMLLGLELAGEKLGNVAVKILDLANAPIGADLVHWMVAIGVVVGSVVIVYEGQTLVFNGIWPPNRLVGVTLDLMVGLLNGWLVVGSSWFYTHKYAAALQQTRLLDPPISAAAEMLAAYTPQALLPDRPMSIYVLVLMLLGLFVLRVIR